MPATLPVPWWGIVPFALLLACIATFPLLPWTRRRWQERRTQLGVALLLGVPVGIWMWGTGAGGSVAHALVEYGQFICLLLALYVVSGGIFVSGDVPATPRTNVLLLAMGAVAASIVGTTGAAMLLIRPLLTINSQREAKAHTVVFAIFLGANCGGLLTPLGDPPLFLGLLRGVPFFWTLSLVWEWLFVNGLLLASYYALDRRLHARESWAALRRDQSEREPIRIHGALNFLWLGVIVLAVAFARSVDLSAVATGHASWTAWMPLREVALLTAAAGSLLFGDRQLRFVRNRFSWAPIQEVAALFIGIFLTMVPALRYLAQVAPGLGLEPVGLFVLSGGLSAVLDNAPTYATFFELARGLGGPSTVAGVPELALTAISLGSVFGGAATYIGNGPNFMVKAIAEASGVAMPTFGGYVVKWSLRYLVPVLGMMVLVFIVQDWRLRLLGAVLGAAYLGIELGRACRSPAASAVRPASSRGRGGAAPRS
jgi:Na+/H+ antiporter NhaD/arsenite permease-like protein